MTTATTIDVVNTILGVSDDNPIATLRNQKPALVTELQEYYDALFQPAPESAAALPVADRYVIAVRVASFTGSTAVADWYTNLASGAGVDEVILNQARDNSFDWKGTNRLDAAIRHADLLTRRPADAQPADLQALKDVGFTPAGIVSLSQTVAFVNYQLRLIAGLRALGERA